MLNYGLSQAQWDPFAELRQLQSQMNRMFEGGGRSQRQQGGNWPPVNMWLGDDSVVVTAEMPGVDTVAPDEIVDVDADVFSPNALGAVLTEDSIARLQVEVVCGGANNQLATEDDDNRLDERGILYAPDYVVNAGGLITVSPAAVWMATTR